MKTQRKSSIFLIELIVSILLFALSSAVCIQLFVHAHNLTEENAQRNQAVLQAEKIVETLWANKGDLSEITNDFYLLKNEENKYVTYYDEEGNFFQLGEYRVEVSQDLEDRMSYIKVEIYLEEKNQLIYDLDTAIYNQIIVGGES